MCFIFHSWANLGAVALVEAHHVSNLLGSIFSLVLNCALTRPMIKVPKNEMTHTRFFLLPQNPFVDSLLKLFLNQTRDEESDIRNNSVFGLGELALHGGQVPPLCQPVATTYGPYYDFCITTLKKMVQPRPLFLFIFVSTYRKF